MVCKNCGNELMENEKFCPQCGQAAELADTPTPEADSAVETSEEKVPSGDTTKTGGDKKAQSVQWDAVKKNLQQGAEIAVPILKAGFGKAKEFTAQTVHEFKDAATEVKGAGVNSASVAVAAKKINWKRLIPIAVAVIVLIFVVRACGGGGSIVRKDSYNGNSYSCLNLKIEDFTKKYNNAYAQACRNAGVGIADNLTMDSWSVSDEFSNTFGDVKQYTYSRKSPFGETLFALAVTTNQGGYICMVSALYSTEQVMGSGDFSGASIHGLLYATNSKMDSNKEASLYSGLNFGTPGNVNINGLMFNSVAISSEDGLVYLGDVSSPYYRFIIGTKE